MGNTMVEALEMPAAVSERYGKVARMYDWFTDYELEQHEAAVGLARLGPRDRVLDVACGTGRGLLALSGRLDPDVVRHGLDLTPAMLDRARSKLAKQGLDGVCTLETGNAAQLPYADGSFDLVYNGYFFDLVKRDAMGTILAEMKRVLRPGGHLVLVNMSKNRSGTTTYEKWYTQGKLGIFSGSCRPVLMGEAVAAAGFAEIERHYRRNHSLFFLNRMFGTEILLARKPLTGSA